MITNVSYAGNPIDNTAMYITSKVELLVSNLCNVKGCLVFISSSINIPKELESKHTFVSCDNPQREYAKYVEGIADEKAKLDRERKYTLASGGYYIGENVQLGDGVIIEPGCFIGHDVVIGNNALIKTGAKIKNATIGDNFIAGENSVIGGTGFTMMEDEQGQKQRIPTLGKVLISNDVEIGALNNISCGSAGDTIIEHNVKTDALVHIGHDAYIHENVEITSFANIAGFVEIGASTYVGINSTLRNRIKIGNGAFIGMGAVVTKNVNEGDIVIGNPAHVYIKKDKK